MMEDMNLKGKSPAEVLRLLCDRSRALKDQIETRKEKREAINAAIKELAPKVERTKGRSKFALKDIEINKRKSRWFAGKKFETKTYVFGDEGRLSLVAGERGDIKLGDFIDALAERIEAASGTPDEVLLPGLVAAREIASQYISVTEQLSVVFRPPKKKETQEEKEATAYYDLL